MQKSQQSFTSQYEKSPNSPFSAKVGLKPNINNPYYKRTENERWAQIEEGCVKIVVTISAIKRVQDKQKVETASGGISCLNTNVGTNNSTEVKDEK